MDTDMYVSWIFKTKEKKAESIWFQKKIQKNCYVTWGIDQDFDLRLAKLTRKLRHNIPLLVYRSTNRKALEIF